MNNPLYIKSSLDDIIVTCPASLRLVGYFKHKEIRLNEAIGAIRFYLGDDDWFAIEVKSDQEAKDLLVVITKELSGVTVELTKNHHQTFVHEKPDLFGFSELAYLTLTDESFIKKDTIYRCVPTNCVLKIGDDEYIEILKGTMIQRFRRDNCSNKK